MLHSNAPDVDKYVATSGPFRNKPRQSHAGLCRINRTRELRRRMIPIIACHFPGHLLRQKKSSNYIAALSFCPSLRSPNERLRYRPTLPGKPGALGLSPGSPLGEAPVPMVPGTVVFGAPG